MRFLADNSPGRTCCKGTTLDRDQEQPAFSLRVRTQEDGRHFMARVRRSHQAGDRWSFPPYECYPFDFLCQEKTAQPGKSRRVFRARVMAQTSVEAARILAAAYSEGTHFACRINHQELAGLPVVTLTKEGKQ
jgi:hypothetical protein